MSGERFARLGRSGGRSCWHVRSQGCRLENHDDGAVQDDLPLPEPDAATDLVRRPEGEGVVIRGVVTRVRSESAYSDRRQITVRLEILER